MTTPYGVTGFAYGENGTTRWLEVTDPLGNKERTEFRQQAPGVADHEPVAPDGPNGMPVLNQYLQYRNTFFWNKAAYTQARHNDGSFDYTQARLYHWCHDVNSQQSSGFLESTKEPLESRVWYFYDGQDEHNPGFLTPETTNNPRYVGRVLDDGSRQITRNT